MSYNVPSLQDIKGYKLQKCLSQPNSKAMSHGTSKHQCALDFNPFGLSGSLLEHGPFIKGHLTIVELVGCSGPDLNRRPHLYFPTQRTKEEQNCRKQTRSIAIYIWKLHSRKIYTMPATNETWDGLIDIDDCPNVLNLTAIMTTVFVMGFLMFCSALFGIAVAYSKDEEVDRKYSEAEWARRGLPEIDREAYRKYIKEHSENTTLGGLIRWLFQAMFRDMVRDLKRAWKWMVKHVKGNWFWLQD